MIEVENNLALLKLQLKELESEMENNKNDGQRIQSLIDDRKNKIDKFALDPEKKINKRETFTIFAFVAFNLLFSFLVFKLADSSNNITHTVYVVATIALAVTAIALAFGATFFVKYIYVFFESKSSPI